MVKITDRVKKLEFSILDVVIAAKKLEKEGKEIIYLNIGDPIQYDFDTPQHIKNAMIDAIQEGFNVYSDPRGELELREAISEKEKKINNIDISPEDIIVTAGVSEALSFLLAAVIHPGDEVLIPGPAYPPYISMTEFFDGKPIMYRTIEDMGWNPDLEDIQKKISDKTKVLIVITPNNPTGLIYKEKVLKEISDLAGEHDILVISDEIYDQITFDKKHISTAAISGDVPVIGVNGFSKAYLQPGWRLGYLYSHDPENKLGDLLENLVKEARIRISTNSPAQKAAIAALRGPQDHIKEMNKKLKERRDYAIKRVNEIEGINATKPEGAFYMFPRVELGERWDNDLEFVLDLLKKTGVLIVHGSGFDPEYGSGHFRMVFLPQVEILEKAFQKIEEFMT